MRFDEEKKVDGLAYDLRQRYAIQLGDLRANILEARSNNQYDSWYDFLDCLYVEIDFKLDDEEKKEYNRLLKETNKTMKDNAGYLENRKTSNLKLCPIPLVHIALRKINLFLNTMMDKYDMFGAVETGEYGGL